MRANPGILMALTWAVLGAGGARGAAATDREAEPDRSSTARADQGAHDVAMPRVPDDRREASGEVSPWTSPTLAEDLRDDLAGALELAVRRLRQAPACRRLFEELGADGEAALAKTLYYPASIDQERSFCRRASALTMVGARPTWICRSFRRLAPNRAATVVLHEALHQSGMRERPLDPHALDSSEINHLVEKSCDL